MSDDVQLWHKAGHGLRRRNDAVRLMHLLLFLIVAISLGYALSAGRSFQGRHFVYDEEFELLAPESASSKDVFWEHVEDYAGGKRTGMAQPIYAPIHTQEAETPLLS